MGDATAFERLEGLAPLLQPGLEGVTDQGRAVLAGEADRVALIGFDRWLGGVHVTAGGNLWRWDAERGAPTR